MECPTTFQVLVPTTERLDRFLADQLRLSRSHAARLVADGAVRVNDDPARASRCLARGDTVVVNMAPLAKATHRVLRPHQIDLDVVFEDDVILVLDKPAGMVVHPAPGHWDDTLLNALVARGTALSSSQQRPGVVHRLDKDTSGLMVLAKTDRAHERLGRALGRRRVTRMYAALAWGHLSEPRTVEAPLARHPTDRKRMAVLATGRPARSLVDPIARFDVCDLVRVQLDTGRTHQIRVHLVHIGHPVVGDPVYGGGGPRRVTPADQPRAQSVARAAPRQALHAAVLGFRHPETDEELEFRSEWPSDLRETFHAACADRTLLDRKNVLDYLGFFK